MSGPGPSSRRGGGQGRRAWIAASALDCLIPPSRAQTARYLTFLVPQPAGKPCLLPRNTPEAALLRLHQAFGAATCVAGGQSLLRANGTEPHQEPLPLDALDRSCAAGIQIHQALARTVGVLPE